MTGEGTLTQLHAVQLQAQPQPVADYSFCAMMAAIFGIFYFHVIRPQQKQQREREAMIKAAAKGDEIITAGGIHGKVAGVDGDVLEVEVGKLRSGERVKVRVARAKIEQVITNAVAAGGDSSKSEAKKTDSQSEGKKSEGKKSEGKKHSKKSDSKKSKGTAA